MVIKVCRNVRRANCCRLPDEHSTLEMLRTVVLLAACALVVGAAAGGRAKRSQIDLQDANLDVPQLIAKNHYPVEVHTVRTGDGYLLDVHRIPRGRDARADAATAPGEPVLVMHGIISSSADFVITGTDQALGYVLADAGYDVWLANARGNYYSRRHVSLNPDRGANFWSFSFDEVGNHDLPALIDYVLAATGHETLHYVGHSQGSTAFLVLGSLQPAYNDKIRAAHLMAPVATLRDLDAQVLSTMADFSTWIMNLGMLIGLNELFPRNSTFVTVDGETTCVNNLLSVMCEAFLPIFTGQSTDDSNMDLMPVIMAHTPAGTSTKSFAHYGQMMSSDSFRRWRHTTPLQDLIAYGSFSPPHYDLSRVTARSVLHFSLGDTLTPLGDVLRLYNSLPNAELRQVASEDFTHFDFAWAASARDGVYADIISIMRQIDEELSTV